MLILARQVTERIILPTVQTSIAVTAIRSGVVRLGIDAPPSIPVLREELLHRHPPPKDARVKVGPNHDKHLLTPPFDLLSHSVQSLVQHPLIRSHPGVAGMLLHFLNQMRAREQEMLATTADAPLR